jgi:hypothetical protein|tara:strand:- start:850 stop:1071 length:222 start_codon:yes stop_codon:yes gene_type:complete
MGNRVKKTKGISNINGMKVQDTQLIPYPTQKMGPSITLYRKPKPKPKPKPYGMYKGPIKQNKPIPYGMKRPNK